MDENLCVAVLLKRKKDLENYGLFSSFEEFTAHLVPKPNQYYSVTSLGAPPKYNGHIYDEDILGGVIPITDEYFGSKTWLFWAANAYLGKIFAKLAMKTSELVKKILRIA